MQAREALGVLAEVSRSQWGMFTSAQARALGVGYMDLTRLVESGDLIRLAHSVYQDAGAPGGEHDDLRAAWLASEPARLAEDRLKEKPAGVTVSGESAAVLHGFGNLRAVRSEFTTAVRRQTQRDEVRYRTRALAKEDVTVREGLPVTTAERTIADLVEQRIELEHIGDVLRDAAQASPLNTARLVELLGPLAARNGHAKGDGAALLEQLRQIAGIDAKSLSKQVLSIPGFNAQVLSDALASIFESGTPFNSVRSEIINNQQQQSAMIGQALATMADTAIAAILAALKVDQNQLANWTHLFGNPEPVWPSIRKHSEEIATNLDMASRLPEMLDAVRWATLTAPPNRPAPGEEDEDSQ